MMALAVAQVSVYAAVRACGADLMNLICFSDPRQ